MPDSTAWARTAAGAARAARQQVSHRRRHMAALRGTRDRRYCRTPASAGPATGPGSRPAFPGIAPPELVRCRNRPPSLEGGFPMAKRPDDCPDCARDTDLGLDRRRFLVAAGAAATAAAGLPLWAT